MAIKRFYPVNHISYTWIPSLVNDKELLEALDELGWCKGTIMPFLVTSNPRELGKPGEIIANISKELIAFGAKDNEVVCIDM